MTTRDALRRPQSALEGSQAAALVSQSTLWEQGAPAPRPIETVTLAARLTDPDTSAEAAASLTPGRIESLILGVLSAPMTGDEIAGALKCEHPPSVKTAVSRLKNAGLVRDSGLSGTSAQGRRAIRWTLT